MTVSIEVYRGSGLVQGPDVTDPLIGSELCALSRGRAELDARAHARTRVNLIMLHRPGLRLGQMIRVSVSGEPWWRGMITGISHVLDGGRVLTHLTIDKPLLE